MKKILVLLLCLFQFATVFSQGITLLYTGAGTSYNDPANWVQVNVTPGQIPLRRPPTFIDDVVFSKARSGVSTISFLVNAQDTFGIGGGASSFCRRMYVYGTDIEFRANDIDNSGADVRVHTSTGGGVVLDSGSILHAGQFHLYGESAAVTALVVRDSKFGWETQHNRVNAELYFEDDGRALFKRSSFAGFYFGSAYRFNGTYTYATGGGLSADSSTFNAGGFILGDNSVDTFLNCSIRPNGINDGGVQFSIGKNASFVSKNDTIFVHYGLLDFTTSGSVFNGLVQGWYFNFRQQDYTHPLPNIINGDVIITEDPGAGISGEVKISGNLTGNMPAFGFVDTPHVKVNGADAFAIGGIKNFGNNLIINNCVQDFCHYKLEFFGSTNSNISWNIGFPVDSLVINKTGCAKVTCTNSLYVAGATQVKSGQLVLAPNIGVPYKFACAGNVDIATGAGLFLKKDAFGNVANIAVAGTITDHNALPDSNCVGFSNPYRGIVDNYPKVLPVTLTDFSGQYQNKAVTLNWKAENELNMKYYTLEKSYDLPRFTPLTTIAAGGSSQQVKTYSYVDKEFLKDRSYYRLKSVDVDGTFTYSKTISVVGPHHIDVSLFPNPVKSKLLVRLPDLAGGIVARIIDGNGAMVKALSYKGSTRQLAIDMMALPAGVYMLVLSSDTFNQTLRFVKE
ncbi:MAG: T9SS type A sorting domain-containing protein [Ferruginibacter sp.]